MTNADGQAIDLDGSAGRRVLRGADGIESSWLIDNTAWRSRRLIALTSLLLGDLAALVIAHSLLIVGDIGNEPALLDRIFILLGSISLFLNSCASLYPGYRLHRHERMRRRLLTTLGIAATSGIGSIYVFDDWSAALSIVAFLALAHVVQPFVHSLVRLMLRLIGCWGDAAVLVTTPELDAELRRYFQENWRYGINPMPARVELNPPSAEGGMVCPVGRNRTPRLALVTTDRISQWDDLAALRREFGEVVLLADLPQLGTSGLRTAEVNGSIGLSLKGNEPAAPGAEPLRRVLDLMIAIPAAIFLGPVMLIAAAAIWLVDPGPVIYRQAREGFRGRTVHVLKLRTMYGDAEHRLDTLLRTDKAANAEWAAHFKLRNDPRILPVVGRILRTSSCDELPQLFNVIGGEMSIIGPRPFPEYHLAAMPADFRQKRASVMPGMTGLWQVSDRSNAPIDLQVKLDEHYIDNRSLWFDLLILVNTVHAVFKRKGAY